jgi:hypothetical protein
MYRTLPSGRHDWLKDNDGVPVQRPIGPKFYLRILFASAAAQREKLTRCLDLGRTHSLEVPEGQWRDFVTELETLATLVDEVDYENPVPSLDGRVIDQATTYDAMVDEAIEFFRFAERYRGKKYTVAIGA